MSSDRGGRYVVISRKQSGTAERVRYNATGGAALASGQQVQMYGAEGGVRFGQPEPIPARNAGFDIRLSLSDERTFVPLGIPDCDGNTEWSFFAFDYSLLGGPVSSLNFRITDEAGRVLHNHSYMEPIVVTARRMPNARRRLKVREPIITWQPVNVIRDLLLTEPDYTQPGDYGLLWDGFDMDGVYDSAALAGKTLTATIIAEKDGKQKSVDVRFRVQREEVDWVDVRIHKNQKRIEAKLRLALTDGGADGLECSSPSHPVSPSGAYPTPVLCPWDAVPPAAVAAYGGRPPLRTRTHSFDQLVAVAIRGVEYHWSRNANHTVAKNVRIGGEEYGLFVTATNGEEHAIASPRIVFQTNEDSGRSRNWEASRILYFNVGYLQSSTWRDLPADNPRRALMGWYYRDAPLAEADYAETAAHEIGHEILLAWGGHLYSKKHKGSSTLVTQDVLPTQPHPPATGEIDLMQYYQSSSPANIPRIAAAESDALALVWLTKMRYEAA